MAVGTTQLFNNFMQHMMEETVPLWGTGPWYGTLWAQAGAHPADTCDNYTAVDATHNVTSSGDYAPTALGTLAIIGTDPQCGFDSAACSFGNPVTITAKYFIVFQGDTTPAGTDKAVFWVNLYDGDTTTEVSSVAGTFSIDASSDGWFYIAGQA